MVIAPDCFAFELTAVLTIRIQGKLFEELWEKCSAVTVFQNNS